MRDDVVAGRLARLVSTFCPPGEVETVVQGILQSIRAGDDIGNGLRAVPIASLEELSRFLELRTAS